MIRINNLTYHIEGRQLFDRATVSISEGWKTGFTGQNGSGKSTLLKMIQGEIQTSDGEISLPGNCRTGAIGQEVPPSSLTVLETVLAFDTVRKNLLAESETAEDPDRIAEIQTRLADIHAHAAPARAGAVLAGLGFGPESIKKACSEFSGGWRMRIALAGILFAEPDFLILDEPTNHLDLEGTIWLQSYLRRYPRTVLVVSHDRQFLDNSVTHIMALKNGRLSIHAGNYSAYEEKSARAYAQAVSLSEKQNTKRREMQRFIDRFRAKSSKAKQAQSRLKMLEKMQKVHVSPEEKSRPFRFPDPEPAGSPLVRIADADLGYATSSPVLEGVNLRIDTDDRIAILGANGEGKSTLVKSIAGRLTPLTGSIIRHAKTSVAYFAQHQLDELDPDTSVLDHVRALVPDATRTQARSATARLGFGADKAGTATGDLSGGERARLLLGLVTFHGPHLLILDEPTNHLDMGSRMELAKALNQYKGAVVLITHDEYLATSVADRLWLVHNGKAEPYQGDMNDYRTLIQSSGRQGHRADTEKPVTSTETPQIPARKKTVLLRRELYPLQQAVKKAETEIDLLQNTLARLDTALSAPDLFEKDTRRAARLSKERRALVSAIENTERKWMAATEQYELAMDEEVRED